VYGKIILAYLCFIVEVVFYYSVLNFSKPILGRCQHTDGTELESCWTATVSDPSHLEDYAYGSTESGSTCQLDEANGYEFSAGQTSDGYVGYGYVTTTGFSGVPIGFMGDTFGDICGFTP